MLYSSHISIWIELKKEESYYSIKIHLNKKIKIKVNHYFCLEFTEFIQVYLNLVEVFE